VRLPAGEFTVTCGRGPEYVPETRSVTIDRSAAGASLDFRLRRWIDPAGQGWYSGDHHIHAAGCSHYESPTEGVRPEDMMRHVLGEALSVGSVLNWGPGYYHQRQFFEAKENKLSTSSTLLRYDLEVSGFPSSYCGHLVLLRVRDQDYPDARQIEDWPLWDLPILKWAKAQGAVTGFAHSGFGLQVKSRELPNYEMPNFDGIGANEYIMDVTHEVVDFISTADTPFVHELNIWYHTLNCGFRTRVSGETDFPCISDERVGAGRSYVHLTQALTFDFDKDVATTDAKFASMMNATNPNLSAFKARGGKIILAHGWNDQLVPPLNTINYYKSVRKAMGARAADEFVRLFMAPGMLHCGGGAGPNTFDALTALEQWAEEGKAPEKIIASHSTNGVVDRTRPLCPYPQVAQYKGTGSTDDATNFVCAASGAVKTSTR
jgi:hypothetical protein